MAEIHDRYYVHVLILFGCIIVCRNDEIISNYSMKDAFCTEEYVNL